MLEIKGLSYHVSDDAGEKDILSGIDLEIRDGAFIVVTGPNGGGKGEEVGVLHHVDADGLIEFPVEDMAEDAVVGRNEILAFGLHHHVGAFI